MTKAKRENTAPDVPRLEGGKWAPGTSPNPGGRPKGWAQLAANCRLESDENLRVLKSIRDDLDAPEASRIMAIKEINDRGWGKAPQSVDVTVADNRPPRELTDEELAREIEKFEKLVEAARAAQTKEQEH